MIRTEQNLVIGCGMMMKRLLNKRFREAYVADHVRTHIAYQVTALRKQRRLTQEDLAKLTSKQQTVISRLEDPDYGPVKLSTLIAIATALDIALSVKFIPFSEILDDKFISPEEMCVLSYEQELGYARASLNASKVTESHLHTQEVSAHLSYTPHMISAFNNRVAEMYARASGVSIRATNLDKFRYEPDIVHQNLITNTYINSTDKFIASGPEFPTLLIEKTSEGT